MVVSLNVNSDFRNVKKGELVQIVEEGQLVIFEGIVEKQGVDDDALIVGLDPIEGLFRKEYPLDSDGSLKEGYVSTRIDHQSEEGRKYLGLLTEK